MVEPVNGNCDVEGSSYTGKWSIESSNDRASKLFNKQ